MKQGLSKLFNYLITLTITGLAVWAGFSLYSRYVENPWTRDGQVRANIVGIAPRVSGPIIRVAVRDNQAVRKGDLVTCSSRSIRATFRRESTFPRGRYRTT